ncbi:hypothetical protein WA026_004198 [Henosepilachna vigintioctopunctata]|uniref:Uncharacterized protein n=1 Tax=Henosepilachna vigintioctopunctata TaxID=420089 RepID=A0AAW1UGP1_9CUCU
MWSSHQIDTFVFILYTTILTILCSNLERWRDCKNAKKEEQVYERHQGGLGSGTLINFSGKAGRQPMHPEIGLGRDGDSLKFKERYRREVLTSIFHINSTGRDKGGADAHARAL